MVPAILGGSFDPVHLGHLALARAAASLDGIGSVVFIPSAVSAHPDKQSGAAAAGLHRLEMLRLAALPEGFAVDDFELLRGGVRYSIDTVAYFRKKHGVPGKVGLIIGDDLLPTLSHWKNFSALRGECVFLVAPRLGLNPADFNIEYRRLECPVLDISSTEIRNRIRMGHDTHAFLPDVVANYIRANGLYRSGQIC